MNACWQKQKRKWESNQIKFNRSLSIFYHEGHEVHEGHEAKNLKYFAFIFVPLRVLCGEWQNSS